MIYAMLCNGCLFKHIGMRVHWAPFKLIIQGLQARWMKVKGRIHKGVLADRSDRQARWFLSIPLLWRPGLPPSCWCWGTGTKQTHGNSETWKHQEKRRVPAWNWVLSLFICSPRAYYYLLLLLFLLLPVFSLCVPLSWQFSVGFFCWHDFVVFFPSV